ncbi:TetR/AcrR family transcriptional regulator [Nonomuraea sp. 10N515B]|uniref:TetR/AcrR family transcriptional regulator n=1 Tax=Nonomuraea sp. 10N515B TaxID=3457422 RepID=UPI003FCE465C
MARGPYAKTAEVRRRVLEACVNAFAKTGFYGATMKDIAKRAGISHTGLLHHFPKKEDLLLGVLELRDERGTRFLEEAKVLGPEADPLDTLNGMIAVIVDNELQPGLMELHAVVSGEATSPDHPAHGYYAERYRNLRRFYADTFARLDTPIDPETLATMTIALINGLQAQWLFDRDSVRLEATIRAFLKSVVPALGDR